MSFYNSNNLDGILGQLLTEGIVKSNENLDLCCPDCTIQLDTNISIDIYVLASVETYLKFAEAIGCTTPTPPPAMSGTTKQLFGGGQGDDCCTHIYASVETELKFLGDAGDPYNDNLASCSDNFNQCVNTILSSFTITELTEIKQTGIIEFGSINNSSKICKINEMINLYQQNSTTIINKFDVFSRILDIGIVICCYQNEIIIASVETWLKWAEQYMPVIP